jgi:hypothetical protein
MTTRLGYDDQNLYLAVDVTDDALVTEGPQIWFRDGLEIFWDPRPIGQREVHFSGPCRQVVIPIEIGNPRPPIVTNPEDAVLAAALEWSVLPRAGGYAVELAIPIASVAEGFKIEPGKTLYMEVVANDKDQTDPKAITSCVVLSDSHQASRRTTSYARVTFR